MFRDGASGGRKGEDEVRTWTWSCGKKNTPIFFRVHAGTQVLMNMVRFRFDQDLSDLLRVR